MIIGLTGGIASGKSTVVEIIKDAGYKVIDADQLVHDMQVKGGRLYQALLDWLGDGILLPNGELNRPKLGQLIFSSEEMRYQSAEIQGKIIREELAAKRDCLAKEEDVFFMDIPLLFENDYQGVRSMLGFGSAEDLYNEWKDSDTNWDQYGSQVDDWLKRH